MTRGKLLAQSQTLELFYLQEVIQLVREHLDVSFLRALLHLILEILQFHQYFITSLLVLSYQRKICCMVSGQFLFMSPNEFSIDYSGPPLRMPLSQ